MAIYIGTGRMMDLCSVAWAFGEEWPVDVDIDKITVFCADHSELDLILKHVHNLPHTDHYLQVWFGEMAKFLYRAMFGLPGVLVDNPAKHIAKMVSKR